MLPAQAFASRQQPASPADFPGSAGRSLGRECGRLPIQLVNELEFDQK